MIDVEVAQLGDLAVDQAVADATTDQEEVSRRVREVRSALGRVSRLARHLSDHPAMEPTGLLAAVRAREEASTRLGVALTRWIADGHDIHLTREPGPGVASAPERSSKAIPVGSLGAGAVTRQGSDSGLRAGRGTSAPDEPAAELRGASLPEPLDPPSTVGAVESAPEPVEPSRDLAGVASDALAADRDTFPAPAASTDTPSRPASAEDLLRLKERMQGGGAANEASAPLGAVQVATTSILADLARRWGEPGDDAAERLVAAVTGLDAWLAVPRPDQQRLLAYAVARAREVQEGGAIFALNRVFTALTAWSATHEPGWVNGLALEHVPRHGSWHEDTRRAWEALGLGEPGRSPRSTGAFTVQDLEQAIADGVGDAALQQIVLHVQRTDVGEQRLINLLCGLAHRLKGERKLKALRKRVLKAEKALRAQAQPTAPRPDPDWPWLRITQGKRVLLLGGDERVEVRERLRKQLGFAHVEWDTGWDPRRCSALAERIQSRSLDLVLVIQRFVQHSSTDVVIPACKRSGVPFVCVDGGYGVEGIRLAIERSVPQPAAEAEES